MLGGNHGFAWRTCVSGLEQAWPEEAWPEKGVTGPEAPRTGTGQALAVTGYPMAYRSQAGTQGDRDGPARYSSQLPRLATGQAAVTE